MSALKAVGSLLGIALLVYLGAVALLYAKQRSLLYFPQFTRDPVVAPDFRFDVDGATLRGWVLNPGQSRALLYFGGNAQDLSLGLDTVAAFAPGHTVYLVAYRGFGLSSGEPTEAALAADAIALFDHVATRHASVDVYGRSLGSGVAMHVAAARPVRRLALVTPFDSVASVGQALYPMAPIDWLLEDRFDSVSRAPLLAMPTLVIIAGRDEVIPPPHSETLVAAFPAPPEVLRLPEARHADVQAFPDYGDTLRRFFGGE